MSHGTNPVGAFVQESDPVLSPGDNPKPAPPSTVAYSLPVTSPPFAVEVTASGNPPGPVSPPVYHPAPAAPTPPIPANWAYPFMYPGDSGGTEVGIFESHGLLKS